MIINLGDTIVDERGRQGELVNNRYCNRRKRYGERESDTLCNAQVYDTDLNYTGAVTFGSNWCYFSADKECYKKE